MKRKRLVLIDGNSLMHRAFYALPQLTNAKGLHTNVIYGFINMLNKIISEYKPDYLTIAFDRKAPTFRHIEYSEYKAQRKKMLPEMAEQIPVLKEVIAAMNINQIELDGYEADDIIGTVSKYSEDNNLEALIVTGDRDAFQLISENVHVLITKKGITDIVEYDEAKLLEDYFIRPDQVTDMKGLMGDASDNIPGVPGIGEKTALELIKEYGKLEEVLKNTDSIKKNKVRENLKEFSEQAVLSKKLATIVREVPIELSLDSFELRESDNDKLYSMYTELEFKSLLEKLKPIMPIEIISFEIDSVELTTEVQFNELISELRNNGEMAIKLAKGATQLLDYAFISDGKKQYYFNINENSKKYLRVLAEDNAIHKVGHDIKQDILLLKSMDIETKQIDFDTMLAAYLLNPSKSSYELKDIYMELKGIIMPDYNSKDTDIIQQYCGFVKVIMEIKDDLKNKLMELDMKELYYEVELPLIEVLADMEHIGFKVDKSILETLSVDFAKQLDILTDSIYLDAGEQFNINSTKQLGVVLFEKLGLPVVKKTKTGYSTDAEVLEALSDKHQIIEKLLEYRQLLKLKSTYIDGLIGIINEDTGKIHSKLNQTVTATGRLSSTDPNLQNIPVKSENGRQIRKVFVPTNPDYILVDADYSQIELRVLAHISNDDGLIEAFKNNEDIHTKTASEVFDVPLDMVTDLMRKRAKAVNFGIVYGISDFGLSRDLKITKKEAKIYIDNYFKRYPEVKKYMEEIVETAQKSGHVKSLLNRIRYIPEVNSKNAIQRNFGERIAMNTPIQASAADIIKVAMVKVYNELKSKNLKSRLILQVHDELIIETHKDEIDQVKGIVRNCMESAFELKVPLVADVGVGYNWYDAK